MRDISTKLLRSKTDNGTISDALRLRQMKTQHAIARTGKILQFNSAQVHILESGNVTGRPVVVLHGCGSLAQEVLLPFENSTHRLIAVDRPGYGHSTPLPEGERGGFGQSVWLEHLFGFLDIRNVVIVAHSIGCAPALHLAARRPDLLSGLLLISPCCRPVPFKPLIMLRAASAPMIGAVFYQQVISRWPGYFVERGLQASSYPNPVPATLANLPAPHLLNPISIRSMADELRVFNTDMQSLTTLPADLPISVLFGLADKIIDPAWHLEWIRGKHPAPTIKLLNGVGHMPHHIAPDFARTMLSDLVSVADTGSGIRPLDIASIGGKRAHAGFRQQLTAG
ncbi:alpha/beta fold hydrolase [Rhizobium tropici]